MTRTRADSWEAEWADTLFATAPPHRADAPAPINYRRVIPDRGSARPRGLEPTALRAQLTRLTNAPAQ
ncbi:hypothetical protein [Streptacidiphilus sp. P02-A3a]|uniref:hypothetical protein n=1 Tax=Streptacidiphilus sp. P02-A3a TaxID=2704468 RepID=UPI0015F8E5A5|nr:hypothetical protein [Streptacidiphilus sp. P02-A3a]QMU67159.1 hypothetical protein GXP74_01970 [Streptacidiphilus sp. P02-A3a]